MDISITSSDYYFDHDSHYGSHEDLLKDEVRMNTYTNILYKNKDYIRDKVILDLSCGIGYFSLICAKLGAKHVIAIDSSNIIETTKEIIKENNYQDKITLLKGIVGKDILKLPDHITDQVDIILCEWYGYMIFLDNKIEQVIYARNNWLKKDNGLILPSQVTLYVQGIEDHEYKHNRFDYWNNVYGYNMKPIIELSRKEPIIDAIRTKQILTDNSKILSINLYDINQSINEFNGNIDLKVISQDFLYGFAFYFNVQFYIPKSFNIKLPYTYGFSTSPMSPETIWKQTVCYIKDMIPVYYNDQIQAKLFVKVIDKNKVEINIKDIYIKHDENDLSNKFNTNNIPDQLYILNQ